MKAKTLFGLLLAAFSVIGFFPMMAQASAPTSDQEVWIGGIGTGVNMVQGSNVTYLETTSSTQITTTEPANWVAKYDGAGTLTLHSGTFNYSGSESPNGAISGSGNLTIQLDGEVTLNSSTAMGIYLTIGDLTISGSGTLNMSSEIYAQNGGVIIQSGTVNTGGSLGIAAFGSKGITISGGNVTSRGGFGIYTLSGPFRMTGGTLIAAARHGSAILAPSMELSSDLKERVLVSMNKDGSGAASWDMTTPLYADDYEPGKTLSYLYVEIGRSGYAMLEGQGENWTEDSAGNLTFRASGDFAKFTGIKVDGNPVDPQNYTASSGSTIITLKNEYLKTLSPGEHKISIVYVDGEAVAGFKIGAQDSGSNNNSGGSSRPAVYAQGETYGDIRVEKSGTKAAVIRREGNEIETIVHPYISAPSRKTVQTPGVYAVDLTLVDAYNDYSFVTLKKGPVDVTFYVPGVEWDTSVIVRQWIGNRYVDVPVEAGSGSIKATFDTLSVSTIVIMVGSEGIAAGTAAIPVAGMVSPKTGESFMVYMAGIIAVLSLTGIVICGKKRKTKTN